MSKTLPPPLVPNDSDLRDFSYMPLDVVRLRDSDIASIDAEAFRAAVLSWCVAWHQSPAASLPDDDASLCRLLGYGRDIDGWKELRESGALRGYIKCSDGRLYHPVVAEKALEALQRKQAQRNRTEAARRQKLSQPLSQPLSQRRQASVTENVTESATEDVTGSKGEERKGKGEERKKESFASLTQRARENPNLEDPEFAEFWAAYPRKVAKDAARKAWDKACKRAVVSDIIAGIGRYQFNPDPQYQPHPATWLNAGSWQVEANTPPPNQADDPDNQYLRDRSSIHAPAGYVPTKLSGSWG